MICNTRRRRPRGAASRGICVDAEGARLGPDCVLVGRTAHAYRALDRAEAAVVQKSVFDNAPDADWLFRRCQRIAEALNKGEIALAQIYALHIPVGRLDDSRLGRIGLTKANLNPDEPRLPKGDPHGGEWTTGNTQDRDEQIADVPLNRNKDDCIRYCFEEASVPRDWGGGPFCACPRACPGKFRSPLFPEFDGHFR